MSEAAQRKERDMVTKEIERLRSSIQMVCRSSLPLGKIMDYIQEDMDAMQAELLMWRRENKEHVQALLEEQRLARHVHNTSGSVVYCESLSLITGHCKDSVFFIDYSVSYSL